MFEEPQSLVNMGRWIGRWIGERAEISGRERRAWGAFHRPGVTWQAALPIAAQALGTIRVWTVRGCPRGLFIVVNGPLPFAQVGSRGRSLWKQLRPGGGPAPSRWPS